MIQTERLADRVKTAALEMGFDQAGITRLDFLKEEEEALQEWIQEGRHGTMKYLEEFSNRRKRFFENFPNAKSVVVLGVNYYSSELASSSLGSSSRNDVIASPARAKPSQPQGRIARYAWGKDYHLVIARKHEEFLERLRQEVGFSFRAESCIDARPLLERHAGVQSGLGFVGKNTMLLSRKFGPWLFLSEIVTDLDLDEDKPESGNCGTCTQCQVKCPTNALDQDYRIDARRCIAYLTIEHKGVIPREFRSKIKDWIFGCDECLSVCPFTSKQKDTRWTELKPESGAGRTIDCESLFSLKSNRLYERQYQGSALLRASRKQMFRNACVVLGNSKSQKALPYLNQALRDSAPLVRLHAAWGLGELGFPESCVELEEQLNQESDPDVQKEIRQALARIQEI